MRKTKHVCKSDSFDWSRQVRSEFDSLQLAELQARNRERRIEALTLQLVSIDGWFFSRRRIVF